MNKNVNDSDNSFDDPYSDSFREYVENLLTEQPREESDNEHTNNMFNQYISDLLTEPFDDEPSTKSNDRTRNIIKAIARNKERKKNRFEPNQTDSSIFSPFTKKIYKAFSPVMNAYKKGMNSPFAKKTGSAFSTARKGYEFADRTIYNLFNKDFIPAARSIKKDYKRIFAKPKTSPFKAARTAGGIKLPDTVKQNKKKNIFSKAKSASKAVSKLGTGQYKTHYNDHGHGSGGGTSDINLDYPSRSSYQPIIDQSSPSSNYVSDYQNYPDDQSSGTSSGVGSGDKIGQLLSKIYGSINSSNNLLRKISGDVESLVRSATSNRSQSNIASANIKARESEEFLTSHSRHIPETHHHDYDPHRGEVSEESVTSDASPDIDLDVDTGDGTGKRRSRKKRSIREKLKTQAKAVKRNAGRKLGRKLAAKGIAKFIPGLGAAYGAYDALDRIKEGDYLGAGIAGLSGIASTVPGIGTGAAMGLDAINLGRDYVGSGDDDNIEPILPGAQHSDDELVEPILPGAQHSDEGLSGAYSTGEFDTEKQSTLEFDTVNIKNLNVEKLEIDNLTIRSTDNEDGLWEKFKSAIGFGGGEGKGGEEGSTATAIKKGEPIEMPEDKVFGVAGKFESGNDPSRISSGAGDKGGKSYGTFQLASSTGDVDKFLKGSGYSEQFSGLKVGSKEFDAKWKELAASDPQFAQAQKEHAKKTHYDPQVEKLRKAGIDIESMDDSVKAAVFSTANQYGANTDKVLEAMKGKDTSKMSSEEFINTLQDYKQAHVKENFRSSSENVQAGVSKRIEQERALLQAQASEEQKSKGSLASNKQGELVIPEKNKQDLDSLKKEAVSAQTPVVEKPDQLDEMNKSLAKAVATQAANKVATPPEQPQQQAPTGGKIMNVRNDDPLLLSLQYGNIRTI